MAEQGTPQEWMEELSRQWMHADPEEAGYLYIDGHVRVYHGSGTFLPKRYVSRQKLCLRGTTDYWVNDALGRPFFVVSKAVSEGLADTLLKQIVPELLVQVPGQPSETELGSDPLLHRFVVVFDREGFSGPLLSKLWEQRIGAITYRKWVKDTWPEEEFAPADVPVPGGGSTPMRLACREIVLSPRGSTIPALEVRRLTDSGHQTSIICTARRLRSVLVAGRMFSRWCQENYFAYMMQLYWSRFSKQKRKLSNGVSNGARRAKESLPKHCPTNRPTRSPCGSIGWPLLYMTGPLPQYSKN